VLCVASWSNYSAFAKILRLIIDCHGQSGRVFWGVKHVACLPSPICPTICTSQR